MNKLNLKNINLQAPYTVHEREDKQHEFYFWSDFGIVYDINFTPNDSIIPSGALVAPSKSASTIANRKYHLVILSF